MREPFTGRISHLKTIPAPKGLQSKISVLLNFTVLSRPISFNGWLLVMKFSTCVYVTKIGTLIARCK